MKRSVFRQRPTFPRIDRSHYLANGLVFAGLGGGASTLLYADASGRGNGGALTNMDNTDWVWAPELGRWALDFDGVNDCIPVGTNLGNFGTGDFSIITWVKNKETGTAYRAIASKGQTSADDWLWYYSNGTVRFYGDSGAIDCSAAANWLSNRANQWIFLAAIRNSGVLSIWAWDAALGLRIIASDATATADIGGCNHGTVVGASEDGTDRFWNGELSDILICDRALSPAEIAQPADRSNAMLSGLILPPRRRIFPAAAAPPAGAIMNQMQGANLGADLFDGTILAA